MRRFYKTSLFVATWAPALILTVIAFMVYSLAKVNDEVSFPVQRVVEVSERNGHPVAEVRNNSIMIEGDICNVTDEEVTVNVKLQWTRYSPRGGGYPLFEGVQSYLPGCERHSEVCEPGPRIHCVDPFVNVIIPEVAKEIEVNPDSLWQVTGTAEPIDKNGRTVAITSEPFYLR